MLLLGVAGWVRLGCWVGEGEVRVGRKEGGEGFGFRR